MLNRFRWQIENKLAGMDCPYFGNIADAESDELKEKGVTAIISLTELPLRENAVRQSGFKYFHYPIPDGAAPSLSTMRAIVETVARLIDQGEKVAVHCTAGLGRTGTILAGYLVHTGMTAIEAIKEVRAKEPFAIENVRQEQAVAEYEDFLKKTGRRNG